MSKEQLLEKKNTLISKGIKFPIYLDYQSTTPMDPRVFDNMTPLLTNNFGNPHSRSHIYGWNMQQIIEKSRYQVASLINADSKEIVFTSGATESNNLAIKGAYSYYGDKKNHIITCPTEHKCIIDTIRNLNKDGLKVSYLKVDKNGLIDLEDLKSLITNDTFMVSIMAVNNEIGVIQPLEEIGKICRDNGVFFHSDIAQAYGKIPIDVDKYNIDLASISAHKIYGPMGIGALYVRKKPRVRLKPIINGGGQERGMRSGTLSPALVSGFGKAAEIAYSEMEKDHNHVKKCYDIFVNNIKDNADYIYINGDTKSRYFGNVNLSFAYIEGESMIMAIKDLAVSSGSACTSASLEPSYVLKALGVDEELAHTSIRFGFGRFVTLEEVEYASMLVLSKIKYLRDMSPLYEMVQEGINLKEINWTAH